MHRVRSTQQGTLATPRRALVGGGPHVGPLTYLFSPHCHLPPAKKITTATIFVFLLSNPRISISLLEPSFPKLFGGIATWYVTPPLLQLVFVLVGYILHNYLLLVLQNELACWILRVLSSLNPQYGLYACLGVVANNLTKFFWQNFCGLKIFRIFL